MLKTGDKAINFKLENKLYHIKLIKILKINNLIK